MKSAVLALGTLATSLFVACASTPAPTTPPSPATPPAPTAAAAPADTFESAFAAARLTKVDVKPIERAMSHSTPTPAVVEGRRVTMTLTAGWNGEQLELAKDASGRIVRVIRQPVETVKEKVIDGCQEHHFAGGR